MKKFLLHICKNKKFLKTFAFSTIILPPGFFLTIYITICAAVSLNKGVISIIALDKDFMITLAKLSILGTAGLLTALTVAEFDTWKNNKPRIK